MIQPEFTWILVITKGWVETTSNTTGKGSINNSFAIYVWSKYRKTLGGEISNEHGGPG